MCSLVRNSCPLNRTRQVATQPVAESQPSAVQVLLSLQVIAVNEQTPEQLSVVQALASSVLIGVFEHAAACVGRAAIAVVAVGVGRMPASRQATGVDHIDPAPAEVVVEARRTGSIAPIMMN